MLHTLTLPFVLWFLSSSNVHAELYKKIDEQGNVTYSDVPSGKAKPVQLPGLTTYGTPALHKQPVKTPADAAKAAAANYTALALVSPANEDTLRENSGTVAVKVTLAPPLDSQAGHKLVVVLDKKPVAEAQATEVSLKDVERGTHTLKVQIADAKGLVLKESTEVTFQLHRGSAAKTGR